MEEKLKVPQDTKDTLLKKAGTVIGDVKEKVEEKAKEKLGTLKEGARNLGSKAADKFTGKK